MTSTPFHVWLSQELERQDRKQSWLARAYWRVLAWMPLPKPYKSEVTE